MLDRNIIQAQLAHTISKVDFPALGRSLSGKVRDSFVLGDRRILVTTDRLSAFDHVLTTIPFKGQLVSEMAIFWFNRTKDIVRNHLIETPHPNVMVTQEVEILPVELVIRGYLTGSAWRDYQAGKDISGIRLPNGMKRSSRFDEPLITPSTKAPKGQHDLPISSAEIVSSGLVDKVVWADVCRAALELFDYGTKWAAQQGLILVDTKYEFGILRTAGKIEVILADEIHTQDSSRFWIAESYQEAFEQGVDPVMLDKEFVRRWLIDKGYMGEGVPPSFPDDFRVDIALKYIEAFEKITGKSFEGRNGRVSEEILKTLANYI